MAKKAEFNIETVKKYAFWVLVPIGLLTTIFVALSAVGKITNDFNARKSALEGMKKNVEGIRNEKAHPNQQTIDDINNKTKETNGRVVAAWRILEKDQTERNLWPEEVGPLFLQEVTKLKWGSEISVDSREAYLNFINDYLPELENFVNRRRVQFLDKNKVWKNVEERDVGSTAAPALGDGLLAADAAFPRGPNGEELYRIAGVVDWPAPETRTVTNSWQKLPKATEIWYAQEELWVYKALLWVIRETNAGATGPHNAAVKRIEGLLIGKLASVVVADRSALRLGTGIGGGADTGTGGGSGSPSGGMGGGMGSSSGGMAGSTTGTLGVRTEAEAADFLKDMRYVDSKAQPLGAKAAVPFNEFNRMPICLRLIVDQRRIPEILVNCANCAMPIEVLWVRFNPGATKPMDFATYGGPAGGAAIGGGGESMGGGGDAGMGTVASPTSGGGGRGPDAGADSTPMQLGGSLSPYGTESVAIEIYGCINIFNSVLESGISASPPATP